MKRRLIQAARLSEQMLARSSRQLWQRWESLQHQMQPLDWPARCSRMHSIPDVEAGDWQPRPGSSSAELALLLASEPLEQRRYLASLLDAAAAGPSTLTEAVERLQLDWTSKLDPLHSHREYAAQLAILTRLLSLPAAAETAYMENETKILPAVDRLLFESLPAELRSSLAGHQPPGGGAYLRWWYESLRACADTPVFDEIEQIGPWPAIPASWLAIGWLCALRSQPTTTSS